MDRATPLDSRILAPIQWMMLIVLILTVYLLTILNSRSRILWSWFGFVPLIFLMTWQCYSTTIMKLSGSHQSGRGYVDEKSREFDVWKYLRSVPIDIEVISNTPWSVYLLSGRPATLLPVKVDYTSGNVNQYYEKKLLNIIEKVRSNKAIVVYWLGIYDPNVQFPDIGQIRALGLGEPIFLSKEALIFGFRPDANTVEK